MLTKEIITDKIEVLEDGQMQVRTATRILENGVVLSQSFHRKVVDVGDDVTSEDQLIQDVAKDMHTPARIAARVAFIEAQNVQAK